MKPAVICCIIMLALLNTIFVACSPSSNTEANNSQGTVVTLERTACHGTCPVYKLTVSDNGTLVFEGKDYTKTSGIKQTTISKSVVDQIVSEFNKINYFSLNDSYVAVTITDQANAITSITLSGKTKTIKHYLGDLDAPKQLTDLENKIDELVKSDQWIK
jgi:hypothetical protein